MRARPIRAVRPAIMTSGQHTTRATQNAKPAIAAIRAILLKEIPEQACVGSHGTRRAGIGPSLRQSVAPGIIIVPLPIGRGITTANRYGHGVNSIPGESHEM